MPSAIWQLLVTPGKSIQFLISLSKPGAWLRQAQPERIFIKQTVLTITPTLRGVVFSDTIQAITSLLQTINSQKNFHSGIENRDVMEYNIKMLNYDSKVT
jgi:2-hydroxychromene-2-carboxylate isomerase